MAVSATSSSPADIHPLREAYRREMDCQIVHDSIHARPGWSREYLLRDGAAVVGYGSAVVGGPWADEPAVYEVYVVPEARPRLLDFFAALLEASGARVVEVQSNDPLAAAGLQAFCRDVRSIKILFEHRLTTDHRPPGAVFRPATPADALDVPAEALRWHGVVEAGGEVAGRGGVLFHYNPPWCDVFMEVAEPFRRRGLGAFLVQELARQAREAGFLPAARCDPDNLASRRTLAKAGFVPSGHILRGVAGDD